MKIRSLSVLVAMILLIGCYSPVAKVDAAEKNYKKEYQKIIKESYKENPGCTYNLIYINKDDIPELVVSNPNCKLRLNGMPVPLLRNGYSIFNGTKYR